MNIKKHYRYYIVRPEITINSYYDLYDTRDRNCYEVTKDQYEEYVMSIAKIDNLFTNFFTSHVNKCAASFILKRDFEYDKIVYQCMRILE